MYWATVSERCGRHRRLSRRAAGANLERLTAASDANTELALTLRPPRVSRDIPFRARTFSAQDGTSNRVVLLTVAGESATPSGAE